MQKIFFGVFFLSAFLLAGIQKVNAEEFVTPPHIYIQSITLDNDALVKANQDINVAVQVKNYDSVTNAGFYIVASVVPDDGLLYSESGYVTAKSAPFSVTAQATTTVVVSLKAPSVPVGTQVRIQAQIFSTGGLPFSFGKSESLAIANPGEADEVLATTSFLQVDDNTSQKEVIIESVRSNVNAVEKGQDFMVNMFYTGNLGQANAPASTYNGTVEVMLNKGKPSVIQQAPAEIPPRYYDFQIIVLNEDRDVVAEIKKTIEVGESFAQNTFALSANTDAKALKFVVKIYKGDQLIDEYQTDISPDYKKIVHTERMKLIALLILGLLIISAIVMIRMRKKVSVTLLYMLVCASLLPAVVAAQNPADLYMQTAQGYVSQDRESLVADQEYFNLISPIGGSVYAPGATMQVTATARSVGVEYIEHTLSVRHNGINGVGNFSFCTEGPPTPPIPTTDAWLSFLDFSTHLDNYPVVAGASSFNGVTSGTVRARWNGLVQGGAASYYSAARHRYLMDAESYHIRCTLPALSVTTTVPTTPGRHKLEIESISGGDNYSYTQWQGVPFLGEYIRGQLYYYVKPAAPVLTKATTTCADRIRLTWPVVTGATSYNVYRSTSENGTYTLLSPTTQTSYEDFPTSYNTTYYYKVAAVLDTYTLESDFSNAVSGQRVVPSCSFDRCTDISGTQSTPLFSLYDRDYFYSIAGDTLHFAPSAATYGAGGVTPQACNIDMCANTPAIESAIPANQDWDRGNTDPYTRYSCSAPLETVCECSGRTRVCLEGGVPVSSTPNASQCALEASCSYNVSGSDVTFSFFATNVIGAITNATPITQPIPSTGSGTISSGSRIIGNTGDGQTDTAACVYPYTNITPPCPDPTNRACDVVCDPVQDPSCPVGNDPGIIAFIATPIVEQGADCVFYWVTQHMASCNLGAINGSSSYNTSSGKNITRTLTCQSDESVPRAFSAVEQCLVRATVKEE